MTLEEYTKIREEIIQEEKPSGASASYPVYSPAAVSRVGIIGSESFRGPVGGGFLPFLPVPQVEESETEEPEAEPAESRETLRARELQKLEPVGIKSQETQKPEYEPIKTKELQKPVYEPIKAQENHAPVYEPVKVREMQEAVYESPKAEPIKTKEVQKAEIERPKQNQKYENVDILPNGNYQDAKTLEEFYREQGIFARDEGNGAGRYFEVAPQAAEKENIFTDAFQAMTEYQKSKMENIGETLGTQIAASALAAPVIGSIASAMAPAAPAVATVSQPAMQNISNIISQSFGRVNTAGVKAAADNAFRQFLTKGTAAATGAAMAGRALVGATAETWDAGKQKMISSYPSYTAPEPVKTQQNYNYNYGATDPSRFTVPTKTAQNYASYTAPVPVKVNLNYSSSAGSATKAKTNANYQSTTGKSTTKYKTSY